MKLCNKVADVVQQEFTVDFIIKFRIRILTLNKNENLNWVNSHAGKGHLMAL